MLDERQWSAAEGPDRTPVLRAFLAHVDENAQRTMLDSWTAPALSFLKRLEGSELGEFICALDCDWDALLSEYYGSERPTKTSRRKLVAGLVEAARILPDWDPDTAYHCLSAMVNNPGIPRPNFPRQFETIPTLLASILAAGIRLPSTGRHELLRGKLEVYFSGFANGDAVMRQVKELYGAPHRPFRVTPEAPFGDGDFRRFLQILADEPAPVLGRGTPSASPRRMIELLEDSYLAWESRYGDRRWIELEPPAAAGPLPQALLTLAASLREREPSAPWLRRAADALDRGSLRRDDLTKVLDALGDRDFARCSEPFWAEAKPALYLYARFRHDGGAIDPYSAARQNGNKLRPIFEDRLSSDPHVGPSRSGTYRNPLTLSKQNAPAVEAACWCLSLFDDEGAVARLAETVLSLGVRFHDSARGPYVRSLAGSAAAICAMGRMTRSCASDALAECAAQMEDPRLQDLIRERCGLR